MQTVDTLLATPLPSMPPDMKAKWWVSEQRRRSSFHPVSRSDVVRIWGKGMIENFDGFDEFEIVADRDATLEAGGAVAVGLPDGSGIGLGILRTKHPKRARLFSVDLLQPSGSFDHWKNHFPRDWLAAIVRVEATRRL